MKPTMPNSPMPQTHAAQAAQGWRSKLRQLGAALLDRLVDRYTVRRLLLLLALSSAFIGGVFIALQSYREIDRELSTAAYARRASLSYLAAATLSEKFARLTDIGKALATRVRFRELVAAGQWEQALAILADVPADFPLIDRMALLTPEGMLMADSPALAGVKGKSFADREWYRAVSAHWEPYVSNVFKRIAQPQINVIVAAIPILEKDRSVIGILVLQVHADRFFAWLKALDVDKEESLYVVDQAGNLAFHPKLPQQSPPRDFSAQPAVKKILQEQEGVEVVFDPLLQEKHLVAYQPLSGYGWGVVVQQPASIAFATRDALLRRSRIAYAAALFFCALLAYFGMHLLGQRRRIAAQNRQLQQEITERQEAAAALQQAKDKAEVANQTKSAFLASMSHELRTPLNAILGYAQILKREKTLNERQAIGLHTIQQSGEHLLTLINDILDLAKIEAGKLELYPNAFNLPAFLRVIGNIIRVKAEQKDLLFEFVAADNLPLAVRADEKRLRQILLNLLSNAVKFTDRGQVSLHVACMADCSANARLRFDIRDTGIGITPQQLETIFQPFEQVGDVQRRAGGTGLGLAISRQLVRLMDSDIQVESQPGRGSLFWFEVVVPVEANMAALPKQRTITGYAGQRKRILVVDDIAPNRTMLGDLLATLGFETAQAADGEQALALAQSVHPDLVLMDIAMPVMGGVEATRRLRAMADLKATPLIAMSASLTEEEQRDCITAGANAFLAKPIEQDSLLRLIGELLQLHWLPEAPSAPTAEIERCTEPAVPPKEDLQALHRLALIANMREIRDWATALAAGDARYQAFTDKLCSLAMTYQSKAILSLVEECLGHTRQDSRETP
ncbi:MAG: response regulator [Burkholderiales bacterium]|nr:response regulator [Burkholderiales bacterium]